MNKPSILHSDMTGVCTVTGQRGVGKTFFASQADLPQNIIFLDFEDKGRGVDAQLNFGQYNAVTQEAAGDPIKLYAHFENILKQIPKDKFTVAIFDNVSPLEVAMRAHIKANAKHYANLYGLQTKNIISGGFGGSSGAANFLVGDICTLLQSKGIRLVIKIAHIGNKWANGGIVFGKKTIKGLDRWEQLSILSIVLIPGRPGEEIGVPAGIVMKEQLGKIQVNREPNKKELAAMLAGEAGFDIQRRLPQRIPECTFQKVRWYLSNPTQIASPDGLEIPTSDEKSPFDDKLSKEQFEMIHAMAVKDAKAIEEDKELEKEIVADEKNKVVSQIETWLETNKSDNALPGRIPEIANALGIEIPEVAVAIGSIGD